jgi:hypothetical protein
LTESELRSYQLLLFFCSSIFSLRFQAIVELLPSDFAGADAVGEGLVTREKLCEKKHELPPAAN